MHARVLSLSQVGVAVLFLAAGGCSLLSAQIPGCGSCAPPETLLSTETNSWTVRKQVNEVQVLFTASRHGRLVTGLTRDDVKVRDNNHPGMILDFRGQDNLPLRVALLIDTSDSIRQRFRFEKEAAELFLRQVLRNDADQALVAGFNTGWHVNQGFSHDFRLLSAGITHLSPGGSTAVFDSVQQACQELARSQRGMMARVLVLVSDGDDNASKSTLETVAAIAQRDEVTIYAIGTDQQADFVSKSNLKYLAAATGGRAMFPPRAGAMKRAFARISEELRHRYAVAYRPPQAVDDGHFHRIRIEARKLGKKLSVRARKGYYAR